MVEVMYRKPVNSARELAITSCISNFDGQITFREADTGETVCLTIEFPSYETAEAATSKLRESGEHVEGPMDYGD
jgi:hypothetical protein